MARQRDACRYFASYSGLCALMLWLAGRDLWRQVTFGIEVIIL